MFEIYQNLIFNTLIAIFLSKLILGPLKWSGSSLIRLSGGVWVKWGLRPGQQIQISLVDIILVLLVAGIGICIALVFMT